MEVLLVVIRVLTPVDGAELQNAEAVAAGARPSSRNILDGRGDVLSAAVSSASLSLGVGGRGGRGQREEVRLGSGSEGEELLSRKARHFDRVVVCWVVVCGVLF